MIPPIAGTDHTREYVPFLAYSKTMKEGGPLENEDTFPLLAPSVADNFDVKMPEGTIDIPFIDNYAKIEKQLLDSGCSSGGLSAFAAEAG